MTLRRRRPIMYETYMRGETEGQVPMSRPRPTHATAGTATAPEAIRASCLAATEARDDFAELLNRVAYRGERIALHRRGKKVAALVPIEDLLLLERLEDRMDLEAARRAMKEKGSISLKDLKAELGF